MFFYWHYFCFYKNMKRELENKKIKEAKDADDGKKGIGGR